MPGQKLPDEGQVAARFYFICMKASLVGQYVKRKDNV